jgi:hypothetical protein
MEGKENECEDRREADKGMWKQKNNSFYLEGEREGEG